MHVLLTGASSFLGRHLAEQLAREGVAVTATYRNNQTSIAGLGGGDSKDNLRSVRLDLANERAFSSLPAKVDAVIHVAGVSSAAGVSTDDMLACNVLGTRNVVRYALAAGAKRLIYMSTLSVYGKVDAATIDENTPVRDPDIYGASKYLGERLIAAAADQIPSIAVRLPGILGRGGHRAWLPTVLQQIHEGKAVTIFNPDASFNNAAHVNDLAAFCLRMMEQRWRGFHAMPVGAAGLTTVRAAVERLMAATGTQVPIMVRPAPQASFTISSDYAVQSFGYRPMEISAMLDRYAADSR
jgi:UDP-glucose 4-epimerase